MKAKKMSKTLKVLKETDNVLEWFPELETFLKNFKINHIKLKFENSKDIFMIYKEEEE